MLRGEQNNLLTHTLLQGGKNDIVGAAAGYVRELVARKEQLSARNQELLEKAASRWKQPGGTRSGVGRGMVVKVQAESQDHSMALGAFVRVLQRLKGQGHGGRAAGDGDPDALLRGRRVDERRSGRPGTYAKKA